MCVLCAMHAMPPCVQAVNLADATWKQVGPDLMMTGYLPSSGGLLTLERACSFAGNRAAAAAAAATADSSSGSSSAAPSSSSASSSAAASAAAAASAVADAAGVKGLVLAGRNRPGGGRVINFYKAWDEWGCLSNFSPHPISMPVGPVSSPADTATSSSSSSGQPQQRQWASVEHFYQSQKFTGVEHADAAALVEAIAAAESPEEAARIGRLNERQRPELVRQDWGDAKRAVMLAALRAKFDAHSGPRHMLLSTAGGAAVTVTGAAADASRAAAAAATGGQQAAGGHQPHKQQHFLPHQQSAVAAAASSSSRRGGRSAGPAVLVENSPHDRYWGQGYDGLGQNHLGQLLMQVRDELLLQQQEQQPVHTQQQQPLQHVLQEQQHDGLGSLPQHGAGGQQQQQVHTSSSSSGSSWQQQQGSRQQDAPAGLAS